MDLESQTKIKQPAHNYASTLLTNIINHKIKCIFGVMMLIVISVATFQIATNGNPIFHQAILRNLLMNESKKAKFLANQQVGTGIQLKPVTKVDEDSLEGKRVDIILENSIIANHRVEPKLILFIDDDVKNVAEAERRGLDTVHVASGEGLEFGQYGIPTNYHLAKVSGKSWIWHDFDKTLTEKELKIRFDELASKKKERFSDTFGGEERIKRLKSYLTYLKSGSDPQPQLGIVTKSPEHNVREALESVGLLEFFSKIISQYESQDDSPKGIVEG